jgi:protein SCO1/2
MIRGPVLIRWMLGAFLLMPVAGVVFTWWRSDPAIETKTRRLPVLGQVSDFSLVEAGGTTVTAANLAGKVWVADFIFTHCAGSCPILTHHLAQAQAELPVRDDLKLVSVSVDPERDTPAVLTEYAARNRADRSRWWFLTGDKAVIRRLTTEVFHLPVADNPESEEEPILHSAKWVLVDRSGAIRGYYDGLEMETLPKLARDVERVLAEK